MEAETQDEIEQIMNEIEELQQEMAAVDAQAKAKPAPAPSSEPAPAPTAEVDEASLLAEAEALGSLIGEEAAAAELPKPAPAPPPAKPAVAVAPAPKPAPIAATPMPAPAPAKAAARPAPPLPGMPVSGSSAPRPAPAPIPQQTAAAAPAQARTSSRMAPAPAPAPAPVPEPEPMPAPEPVAEVASDSAIDMDGLDLVTPGFEAGAETESAPPTAADEADLLKDFSGEGEEPWLQETMAHLTSEENEKALIDQEREGQGTGIFDPEGLQKEVERMAAEVEHLDADDVTVESPAAGAENPGSLTLNVTGGMTLKLKYETDGQEVHIGFTEQGIHVRLVDGTEFKIPVRRKALKKVA